MVRKSGVSSCPCTVIACCTAASKSSSSLSALSASVQFISLGNSRQSMNLRPIFSSLPCGPKRSITGTHSASQQNRPVEVRFGSNASAELSWHVGFTPDFGRIAARQRTDASGQDRNWLLRPSLGSADGFFTCFPSLSRTTVRPEIGSSHGQSCVRSRLTRRKAKSTFLNKTTTRSPN